jgi:hypothetical protein
MSLEKELLRLVKRRIGQTAIPIDFWRGVGLAILEKVVKFLLIPFFFLGGVSRNG